MNLSLPPIADVAAPWTPTYPDIVRAQVRIEDSLAAVRSSMEVLKAYEDKFEEVYAELESRKDAYFIENRA